MSWTAAPSLLRLRDEVNKKYPKRDKASDGIIGDPAHSARVSDHNPCDYCTGKQHDVVHAMDVDSNGAPGVRTPLVEDVLRATIGDDRVWYVIWNGKIYSRTYGWAPRVYTGANRHDHHVHVSLRYTDAAVTSTGSWLQAPPAKVPTLPGLSLANLLNAARHPRKATNPIAVRRLQRALNAHGFPVTVDGIYGPVTRAVFQRYERTVPHSRADGLPGMVTLTALGRNRWRVTR